MNERNDGKLDGFPNIRAWLSGYPHPDPKDPKALVRIPRKRLPNGKLQVEREYLPRALAYQQGFIRKVLTKKKRKSRQSRINRIR